MTTRRKLVLNLLIAICCVSLFVTSACSFSGSSTEIGNDGYLSSNDIPSDDNSLGQGVTSTAEIIHHHEWSHDDAIALTQENISDLTQGAEQGEDNDGDSEDDIDGQDIENGESEKVYYLDEDLSGVEIIIDGHVEICLNGHRIEGTYATSVFTLGEGRTLVLYDCGENGDIGVVTGGYASNGGGVYVGNNATFVMYGGIISDNTADNGAGVYVDGGSFEMIGGKISGNTASGNGGGVYVEYGVFAMTGGAISENESYGDCGGVYIGSEATFNLSGAPYIQDNRNIFSLSNVYLPSDSLINLTGDFEEGAQIGITMENSKGKFATGWNSDVDPSAYFTVDNFDEWSNNVSVVAFDGGLAIFASHKHDDVVFVELCEELFVEGKIQSGYYFLNGYFDTSSIEGLDGGLVVEGEVSLCLNGNTLSCWNGSVITISSGASFALHDCESYGQVTDGNASNGGGVYVESDATFTMYGGSISNNTADNGGGVYVDGGSFEMRGGSINGNMANENGGGIYVGNEATFEISGEPRIIDNYDSMSSSNIYLPNESFISISGNFEENAQIGVTLENGRGVFTSGWQDSYGNPSCFISDAGRNVIPYEGELALYATHEHEDITFIELCDEFIEDGNVVKQGNYFLFEDRYDNLIIERSDVSDGEVNFCLYGQRISYSDGSVIAVNSGANFILHDCGYSGQITGGNATNGGGVNISGGTFVMNGGSITGNTATNGGGVYVNGGTFVMNGGSIIENYANNGGGVYVDATFCISGEIQISGNANSNVYLTSGNVISLGEELDDNSHIGVTLAESYGVFTSGWNSDYGNPLNYFSSDDKEKCVVVQDGELAIAEGHKHDDDEFVLLQNGESVSEGKYYLSGDFNGNLVIDAGTVELCLNGCVLSGEDLDSIVKVNSGASFILYDCSGAGLIKGGNAENGGAVYVDSNATFAMQSGTITENTATENGGGVYVNGGTFEMYGGSIIGNSADCGGGIYIKGDSAVTLIAGRITENVAEIGAGVYVDVDVVLNISGTPYVLGNYDNEYAPSNVYLSSGSLINAVDITSGAQIGVKLEGVKGYFTNGWNSAYGEPLNYFSSDDYERSVVVHAGKLAIYAVDNYHFDATYIELCDEFFVDGILQEGNYFLLNDIDCNLLGGSLLIQNNVSLCLRGCNITATEGSVITVNNGATFTLCDCQSSGRISGGNASNGGGVYVVGSTFVMDGGYIEGNIANVNGGGVYIDDISAFTMTGGFIVNNTAKNCGGGVYIDGGEFTLIGGTIGNILSDEFTGSIGMQGNVASVNGGGVYINSGILTMSGGSIVGNIATADGGGVYIKSAEFTMSGGAIGNMTYGTSTESEETSANTAINGGGVYVDDSTFEMTGGSITGNVATENGGGVYLAGGSFAMKQDAPVEDDFFAVGVSITNNTANANGGGVYVSDAGEFSIGGKLNISGNRKNSSDDNSNVYLASGKIIDVTAQIELSEESVQIGITLEDDRGIFTSSWNNSYLGSPSEYFVADNADSRKVFDYNQQGDCVGAIFVIHKHADEDEEFVELREEFLNGGLGEGHKFFLVANYTDNLEILDNIDICLNGFNIGVEETDVSVAVKSDITFTLNDCQDSGNLFASVKVEGGKFILNGGTVTNGVTVTSGFFDIGSDSVSGGTVNGGVVFEGDELNMVSGTINGGLTFSGSSFTMTGGTINDGVIVTNGSFTMGGEMSSGGEINGVVKFSGDSFDLISGVINNGLIVTNGSLVIGNEWSSGVTVKGGLTISGESFNGNEIAVTNGVIEGEVIIANGSLVLTRSSISGNVTVERNARLTINTEEDIINGGIVVNGTFVMIQGAVRNAEVGVLVNEYGQFTMSGGSISDNEIGVKVVAGDNNVFTISGSPVIDGNTLYNVYLGSDKTINISGELTFGAHIGVTLENVSGIFTFGWNGSDLENCFSADDVSVDSEDDYGREVVLFGDELAVLRVHTHSQEDNADIRFYEFLQGIPATVATNYFLADDYDESLLLGSDTHLCLNGHTVADISLSEGAIFTLYDDDNKGSVTNCLYAKGMFTMNGGTLKSGVNIDGIDFIMNGGVILGGFTVDVAFAMEGGAITGDINVSENATFTMNSGSIKGSVSINGGTFTMSGESEIFGSDSDGVIVESGWFYMYGGSITDKEIGVKIIDGSFTMTGGRISGNGIGVQFTGGSFALSGSADITGNKKSIDQECNVLIENGNKLTVGQFEEGAKIGITLAEGSGIFTLNWLDIAESVSDLDSLFMSDEDDKIACPYGDNLAIVRTHMHSDEIYVELLEGTTQLAEGNYFLANSYETSLDIKSKVQLCLNNCLFIGNVTIDGGEFTLHEDIEQHGILQGDIFVRGGSIAFNGGTVRGNVTIEGGSASMNSNGTIVGNIDVDGSFELNNGTIYGSVSIVSDSSFTIKGGEINGNVPSVDGQTVKSSFGIQVNGGTLSISGGLITNSQIGVELVSGEFTMTGGTITNNEIGVFFKEGVLALSGKPIITGNASIEGQNCNILIASGKTITVGEFDENNNIGISLESITGSFISLWDNGNEPSTYFTSDDGDRDVILMSDNSVAIYATHMHNGELFIELVEGNNISSSNKYFLFDNFAGNLTINANVSLCLNGHVLDGSVTIESGDAYLCDDNVQRGKITGGIVVAYGSLILNDVSIGGKVIVENGVAAMNGESAIFGGVEVSSSFELNNGTIYGGVLVKDNGSFTMNGESKVTGNVKINGSFTMNENSAIFGGVEVSGSFELNNGTICGGVLVKDNGSFTMNGGEIKANIPNVKDEELEGGNNEGANDDEDDKDDILDKVVVEDGGSFTMTGGSINNDVEVNGAFSLEEESKIIGNVVVNGSFTMDDNTTITGNIELYGSFELLSGTINGSVIIEKNGAFTMEDGEINGNTSNGVEVKGGEFTMSGGTITNGVIGVYILDGEFTMTGGEIVNNEVGVKFTNGIFNVSGSVNIIGNDKDANGQECNVYIENGNTITVDEFEENAAIGITIAEGSGIFTSNWQELEGDADVFTSDDTDRIVYLYGDNLAIICTHEHDEITYIELLAGITTLTEGNYFLTDTYESDLLIKGEVELCLNDQILIGSVTVEGEFILHEDDGQDGKLDGNVAVNRGSFTLDNGTICGSVLVKENCSFILNGGAITARIPGAEDGDTENDGEAEGVTDEENGDDQDGDGEGKTDDVLDKVIVEDGASFTMNGGSISIDIKVNGTFSMCGGAITGNIEVNGEFSMDDASTITGSVEVNGKFELLSGTINGSVIVEKNGSLTMEYGEINGNTSNGVEVKGGTFIMKGGSITNSVIGVYILDGEFTMIGGEIVNNEVGVKFTKGVFNVSGSVNITGNDKQASGQECNVYIENGNTITVDEFEQDAAIGITIAGGSGIFTSNWQDLESDVIVFKSDDSNDKIVYLYGDNLAIVRTHKHSDDEVFVELLAGILTTLTDGNYFLADTYEGDLLIKGEVELCLNDQILIGNVTVEGEFILHEDEDQDGQLDGNVTVNSGSFTLNGVNIVGSVTVESDCDFTMNGGSIGQGVEFNGDNFVISAGEISNGVTVSGGTFTMTDEAKIIGLVSVSNSIFKMSDSATIDGDVSIDGGSFTISDDATIEGSLEFSGNELSMQGGAINNGVTFSGQSFEMTGGSISNGVVISNGTLTVGVDCVIAGNVTVEGSFELNGGTINGSVFVTEKGVFNMNDGEVIGDIDEDEDTDNTSVGVHVKGGRFTMTDGKIDTHTTGVLVEGGTFNLSGGEISNNGKGVHVASGTFNLSAAPKITGNHNNVYLGRNMYITIVGTLSNTEPIGVTLESVTGVFVERWDSYEDPTKYFASDYESRNIVLMADGSLAIYATHTHGDENFVELVSGNSAPTEGNYFLAEDFDGDLTINGNVKICLNGNSICGSVTVNGVFTLCNHEGQPGEISGDVSIEFGSFTLNGRVLGKVIVASGCSVVMEDGYIGDGVEFNGDMFSISAGEIANDVNISSGTFVMTDESIINGSVVMTGGTFRMSDSAVIENDVSVSGGSFTLNNDATINGSLEFSGNMFNMFGGAINNGVVFSGTSFDMSSGYIANGVTVSSGIFTLSENAIIYGNVVVNEEGTFSMIGGEINGVAPNGDEDVVKAPIGVKVDGGTFTMTEGEIFANVVGVKIVKGTFTMSGGTISNNETGVQFDGGTFRLNGRPFITGNENINEDGETVSCNVFIESGNVINVGAFYEDAEIGITLKDGSDIFTADWTYSYSSQDVFSSDDGVRIVYWYTDELALVHQLYHDDKQFVELINGTTTPLANSYFLADDYEGDLTINVNVELCLNNHMLMGKVTVNSGTFTLHEDEGQAGKLQGDVTVKGGSFALNGTVDGKVMVVENGSVTMQDGLISEGVEFNGVSFTMNGGVINSNLTVSGGKFSLNSSIDGDVKVEGGSFIINGEVSGNVIVEGGSATMIGGSIAESVAVEKNGEFTLNGGSIDGEVTVNGTFTIGNGNIYKTVTVQDGTLLMSGGQISNATTGVDVAGGIFAMSGGSITQNNKGVNVTNGVFQISGKPDVSGNDVNVFLASGKKINVVGVLDLGATIYITLEDIGGIFTDNWKKAGNSDVGCFYVDGEGRSISQYGDEVAIVITHTHKGEQGDTTFVELLKGTETLDTGCYVLLEDYTGDLTVIGNVELCLNGFILTGNLNITANGRFTLHNCQESGEIADVVQVDGGSFTMESGLLRGGVQVLNQGALIINDGEIYDIVDIAGTLTMNGGVIYSDVDINGTFNLRAGTVAKNVNVNSGSLALSGTVTGAVNVASDCSVTMNGGSIEGGVKFEGDTFNMVNGTISNGVEVTSGTFAFSGSCYINGNVNVTGGSFASSGAVNGKIIVEGDGTVTMNGGTISAGVTVNSGTFTMYTGTVTGSVQVSGADALFTMRGDYIRGDVTVSDGATFELLTGTVTNDGTSDGVQVNGGKFLMSNGTISGTKTGVVVDSGAFEMTGGNILDNVANGISVVDGLFKMTNGTIMGNVNGVDVDGGTLQLTGGTISFNSKGVNVVSGDFLLSGNPVFESNNSGNVYLFNEAYITINGALTNSSRIGVTLENGSGIFTENWGDLGDPTKYFASDEGNAILKYGDEVAVVRTHEHSLGQGQATVTCIELLSGLAIPASGNYFLADNFEGDITIALNIVLCLNGHTVTGGIDIDDGNLTLYDCGSGSIVGSVTVNGSFTLENGTIDGSGNGVVLESGSFTMNGGQIINAGVGVSIVDGIFTMTGGTIADNDKGVDVTKNGVFKLSGKPIISDNSVNVYLVSGQKIVIIGEVDSEAKIYVTLEDVSGIFTENWKQNGNSNVDCFRSDNEGGDISAYGDEVAVVFTHVHEQDGKQFVQLFTGTETLDTGIYALLTDFTGSLIIIGDVELCLNGCTLNGNIIVTASGKLTLHNCEEDGIIAGNAQINGGELIMVGGAIEQNVQVTNNGVFTMNGGTLCAGAEISGTFKMNAGTVTEDVHVYSGSLALSATISGQLIVESGSVTMDGGSIGNGVEFSGSTFEMTGGAISNDVIVTSGKFTMAKGVINGDVTVNGEFSMSGDNVVGSVTIENNGLFTLLGGTVEEDVIVNSGSVTMNGGAITGDVTITSGTVTMSNGEIQGDVDVTGGSFTISGTISGQVYVDGGSVTMNGGSITNSVTISNGSFTMSDGQIDRDVEVTGGSFIISGAVSGKVTVVESGAVTMNGGSIGNGVEFSGSTFDLTNGTISKGVIVTNGTFTISGGAIQDGVTVDKDGSLVVSKGQIFGDVTVDGTFSMTSGTINGTVSGKGQFVMEDGEITNATNGVVVNGGTFTMTGGTITGNTIGVLVEDGTFNVRGTPKVYGNSQNVYLSGNSLIKVVGALSDGAKVYVTLSEGHDITFTSGYRTYNRTEKPAKYFFADDSSKCIYILTGSEANLGEHPWGNWTLYEEGDADSARTQIRVCRECGESVFETRELELFRIDVRAEVNYAVMDSALRDVVVTAYFKVKGDTTNRVEERVDDISNYEIDYHFTNGSYFTEDDTSVTIKYTHGGVTITYILEITVGLEEDEVIGSYSRENWHEGKDPSEETLPTTSADEQYRHFRYYTDSACTQEYTGGFNKNTPAGTYYVKLFTNDPKFIKLEVYLGSFTIVAHSVSNMLEYTTSTCDANGQMVFECYVCGETITRLLEKTEHNWVAGGTVTKYPTCADTGWGTMTCTFCGTTTDEQAAIPATGHTRGEGVVTKLPDCNNVGEMVYYCKDCGVKLDDQTATLPRLAHKYSEGVVVREPTCEVNGEIRYYCVYCGDYTRENIDALGHNWIQSGTAIKDATCTQNGEGKAVCSTCGDERSDGIIPAKGHNYADGIVVTPATCVEEGKIVYVCIVCNYRNEKVISKIDHEWTLDSVITDATCTVDGQANYVCSHDYCSESKIDKINALGHELVKDESQSVEVSCTREGKIIYTCSRANCNVTEEVKLEVLGHDWIFDGDAASNPASCQQTGRGAVRCSRCNATQDNGVVPVTGHSWELQSSKAATCTQAGTNTYQCQVCGLTYEEQIAATSHEWIKNDRNSRLVSCMSNGHTAYSCKNCTATRTEITYARGHEWSNAVVTQLPTCNSDGVLTYFCKVCYEELATEAITKLDHVIGEGVVTQYPTCDDKGEITYRCLLCEYSYTEEIDEHGHYWVVSNVPGKYPTCTDEGFGESICAYCGKTRTEGVIPALGHVYDKEVVTPATCAENGKIVYTCIYCDDSYEKDISKLTHEWIVDHVTQSATCFEDGKVLYKCSRSNCDETYEGTLDKLGHKWITVEDGFVAKEASCTQAGLGAVMCEHCGLIQSSGVITALGHDWIVDTARSVDATCEHSGVKVYKCSRDNCSERYSEVIPATGHAFDSYEIINATCTTNGKLVYSCSNCDVTQDEIIFARGHKWDDGTTYPATCTEDGKLVYECAHCEETIVEILYSTGHDLDEGVETPATCTEDGKIVYTCSKCEETIVEILYSTGHEWDDGVETPATCTEDGSIVTTCKKCDEKNTETIKATGHEWGEVVETPVTCTEDGSYVSTCKKCDEKKIEVIKATGHEWDDGVETPATCTEDGAFVYTCKKCDETQSDTIKAIGHKWDDGTLYLATCTEDGKLVYSCYNCGEEIIEVMEAIGHNWDRGTTYRATCTEDGKIVYECRRCDETRTEVIAATGHEWDDGVVTTEATAKEDGVVTYTCSKCDAQYTEVIPATGDNTTGVLWWMQIPIVSVMGGELSFIIIFLKRLRRKKV